MFDVAIIGGGPSGLLVATHLAQAGLDVTLFEEHPAIGTPVHCTGIVSQEVAGIVKIPDDVILGRLLRAAMVAPNGQRVEHRWLPASGEDLLVIDRARFDMRLAEDARAAGATIRTSARVNRLEPGRDGVFVGVGDTMAKARACVLACGVSYRFQRDLGLGLPGQVIHTAQIEVGAEPSDAVELYFGRHVAPEGFVWTVPILRDGSVHMKVGTMARGNAGAYLRTFLDRRDIRARLRTEPGEPVRRLLPLKPLPKTYADRVLVVGDAGGFTKPTTGGGIFYSLLTAALAAERLVEGFHAGRLDDAFLSRYEARWQDRLGQELRVADWLRTTVAKCTDHEINALIDAMASHDVQLIIRRTARFNWHRDVILAMVRQPGIKGLLVRALFR